MARELKNTAASVRARLLDLARSTERDFQLVLTNYALERLLYRLSTSVHKSRFILKGALLFTVWLDDPFRPTRDLDLLGSGDPEAEAVASVFRTILSHPIVDDGLVFDIDGLKATTIREAARYGGIHVETQATLERARVPIRIDIGYGDAVTPGAMDIDYPTLLDGPAPRLRAYPRETVVAEKLEAITSLGMINTRMKDFYDLYMLSRHFEFDGRTLATAVRATFRRRRTVLSASLPDGLTEAFASRADVQTRWRAFLARDKLATDIADFSACVSEIRIFAEPILKTIGEPAPAPAPTPGHWPPAGPWRVQ